MIQVISAADIVMMDGMSIRTNETRSLTAMRMKYRTKKLMNKCVFVTCEVYTHLGNLPIYNRFIFI